MMDAMTAVAQILALENGTALAITAGVACDVRNPVLVRMAETLSERLGAVGINLLALRLEGDTLVAHIDERAAEEPLCPVAFRSVVRSLSYQLTGYPLDARIEEATPAATEAIPTV